MSLKKKEFNTGEPIAYLITWTTYGTWLQGDERGWKRRGAAGFELPNSSFKEAAKDKMKESSFLLTASDREVVEKTVRKHCEVRGWELHAVNARSNHVHVVVTSPDYDPAIVSNQLKAWSSRLLKKTSYPDRERFWTERSGRRWINHESDLDSVIVYVLEAQDLKGVEQE